MFKSLSHERLRERLYGAPRKTVIVDFPENRRLYVAIGHNSQTKNVLGSSFLSKKDSANSQAYSKPSFMHCMRYLFPTPLDVSFQPRKYKLDFSE